MSNRGRRAAGAGTAIVGATLLLAAGGAGATTAGTSPGTFIGPRTTVSPYVIPVNPANTSITSILTVDDLPAANNYPMAGLADGLGAYQDGSSVVLLSNHELNNTQGVIRTHGAKGSFVSQWTLNPTTLDVTAGKDAMTTVAYASSTPPEFSRFCSADLATAKGLYNSVGGVGYNGNLFMSGEEVGIEGRAVATDPLTGSSWVLPAVGRLAWENALVADTHTSNTTLVIGQNDTTPTAGRGSANLVYVGTKDNAGTTPVEKAGLTNGSLFGVVVTGASTDAAFRTAFGVGSAQPFTLVALTGATGAALQTDATAKNVFAPDRTEDGAWDPSNPNDFYFVTTGSTASATGRGGLWKQHWNDVNNPSLGGTLTLLVDHPGTHAAGDDSTNQPGFYMPDNMTIDGHGHILLQEDPGGDNYLARIFAYDIATGQLKPVATFDPAKFAPGPGLVTNDEEASGIIDTESLLGAGTFLFDAQVHTPTGLSNATRDAERGQYLVMSIDFANLFATAAPEVPEAPLEIMLPISALVVLGGAAVVVRRRHARVDSAR